MLAGRRLIHLFLLRKVSGALFLLFAGFNKALHAPTTLIGLLPSPPGGFKLLAGPLDQLALLLNSLLQLRDKGLPTLQAAYVYGSLLALPHLIAVIRLVLFQLIQPLLLPLQTATTLGQQLLCFLLSPLLKLQDDPQPL